MASASPGRSRRARGEIYLYWIRAPARAGPVGPRRPDPPPSSKHQHVGGSDPLPNHLACSELHPPPASVICPPLERADSRRERRSRSHRVAPGIGSRAPLPLQDRRKPQIHKPAPALQPAPSSRPGDISRVISSICWLIRWPATPGKAPADGGVRVLAGFALLGVLAAWPC